MLFWRVGLNGVVKDVSFTLSNFGIAPKIATKTAVQQKLLCGLIIYNSGMYMI